MKPSKWESETSVRVTKRNLLESAKSLYLRGMVNGCVGNLSVKVGGVLLATPMGIPFRELNYDDISQLDDSGNLLFGKKPTDELPLHLEWYAANPEHKAVVHLHSPAVVALSCMDGLNPANILPWMTAHQVSCIGKLPLMPFALPKSATLLQQIKDSASQHRALVLANHGSIVGANTLEEAIEIAEEVEFACQLYMTLQGAKTKFLTEKDVKKILSAEAEAAN